MNNLKIGSFLQALRKAKGLTQAELADYFEISAKTVSKWECGDSLPEIPMLKALADYYEVSIDEILNGEKGESKTIEKTRQKNENFFYKKKMSKLNFVQILSFSILSFGYLMLYVLGYTTNRSDVGGWVSIAIYFISILAFVFGLYMTGDMDEDFEQSMIKSFKRKRFWFIYSYAFSLIFAFVCSILFYAIPPTKNFVVVMKDFSWINFLVLLVVGSFSSLYPFIHTGLKEKENKVSKILYSLLYYILLLISINGVLLGYTNLGNKAYFSINFNDLEITFWYKEYLNVGWMFWVGIIICFVSIVVLWYVLLKKHTYIFSMLIYLAGIILLLVAVSDISSNVVNIHTLYGWIIIPFYIILFFIILESIFIILRYIKNKKKL